MGGSGARYSGVMYRSPTDEIMLDMAAAADDTEREVAAAAAAAAAAEDVDEAGGEVEPLGEDANNCAHLCFVPQADSTAHAAQPK